MAFEFESQFPCHLACARFEFINLILLITAQLQCHVHVAFSNTVPGANLAVNTRIDTDVVINTSTPTKCSLYDLSNGTLCDCGIVLQRDCGHLRSSAKCASCTAALSNSSCSPTHMQGFCSACSPPFDFSWVALDKAPKTNISLQARAARDWCEGRVANVDATKVGGDEIELLQTTGCNELVLGSYFTSFGYNYTYFEDVGVLHGDSVDVLLYCCKNFQNSSTLRGECGNVRNTKMKLFYETLKTLTQGCKRDLLEEEIEGLGLDIQEIERSSPFGQMYGIDLRKLSILYEPMYGFVLNDAYCDTVRYLTGLTFAATSKHKCSDSWFMPGASRLYADSFKVQGDFYFPASIPEPFETDGTCGKSTYSETNRLDACVAVGTYLYDNAKISGMSIVGCAVDCTAAAGLPEYPDANGAFVSVSFLIIEVDTATTGFGKTHGGLDMVAEKLNTGGMNLTNDLHATVGIGFHFSVSHVYSDDLLAHTRWDLLIEHESVNYTAQECFPNMSEAKRVYAGQGLSVNSKVADDTIEFIAIVASVVVVLTLLGIVGYYYKCGGAKSVAPSSSAIVVNDYEDEKVVALETPTAHQLPQQQHVEQTTSDA